MDEENDILEALRDVQGTIAEWEKDEVFEGNRGYQDLLERESNLQERLEELRNETP